MSRTSIATTDDDRKVAQEEKLFRDTVKSTFFLPKLGGDAVTNLEKGMPLESSPDSIVHIKSDLGAKGKTKTANGDKVVFTLIPRLDPATYAGVTSGQTLKGKELALTRYTHTLELERYRQAVSAGTPLDQDRVAYNLDSESKSALLNWGNEKVEKLCWDALDTIDESVFYKTSSGLLRNTAATAKAAISLADSKLTPAMLTQMKTWASTGGNRTKPAVRPVMVGGKPYYVLVCHPDVLADWKMDSTYQQAAREAMDRGKENPIFAGADFVWDGVVIHSSEFGHTAADGGGSTVTWSKIHLLGQQSLCVGFGERASLVYDTEDYEEDAFWAWRITMKVNKPKFNSLTYGSVSAYVSHTAISSL